MGRETEAEAGPDPIASWSLLASAHMRCILERWNHLYKMLQADVSARKRREQKRLCPEPKMVTSTATTMEFSWWHTSEEWDPIPGCTYQLCLRIVNPELDDGIGQMDLNGFDAIYTGRDSGCIVQDLIPGTVYQCRLKALFGHKKSKGLPDCQDQGKSNSTKRRQKRGIKWSAPIRATTLSLTPASVLPQTAVYVEGSVRLSWRGQLHQMPVSLAAQRQCNALALVQWLRQSWRGMGAGVARL